MSLCLSYHMQYGEARDDNTSLTTAATQQIFPQSIVSRYLATRGNNKILRTPPPHISSSEEILPRLTRRTLAQLRTNKSPFLKSHLHKVDAKTHCCCVCPPLFVGGVWSSRFWSTIQLISPSDQQLHHSCGVCPQIQGWQCGAYVSAVEEMVFIVSKALLISSTTVIVRAGGAIWLNPFVTVLFSVCSAVTVQCCVLYPCCMGVFTVM